MSTEEERTIEVTVLSASDLKKVAKFGFEQKCFAEVYIYPSQKQATANDVYNGINPNWNAKLKLTCLEVHLHPSSTATATSHKLTVDLFCKTHGILHKDPPLLGTVTIPLKDIGAATDGFTKVFDVHLPTGEVQGSLFLSVKLGAKRPINDYEDPSLRERFSQSSSGKA